MSKVIYSMALSLDGFVAGPRGDIAVVPDEELHRFHNQEAREFGAHLYGRRLYEVMSAWETYADENPSAPEHELEFARIWKATPKVVFSRTLDKVGGNATLAEGDAVGGGTPFFPPLDERVDLHLVETRTFGSGAVCLRYSSTRSMPPDALA